MDIPPEYNYLYDFEYKDSWKDEINKTSPSSR